MAQQSMAAVPALKDSFLQLKTRMDKAVDDFRTEMAAVRTGRASVHMLDSVQLDYYGSMMPLNQVAQVHAPEPQLITVQPFDASTLGSIEKAIRGADLGLNPMNDGKLIRVPVPALTVTTTSRTSPATRSVRFRDAQTSRPIAHVVSRNPFLLRWCAPRKGG